MIDPKLTKEVPAQIRELAVKSVDQAEKAISTFMESASKSFAMAPAPMGDVAKQALTTTEANIKASFEHARRQANGGKGYWRSLAASNRIRPKPIWHGNRTIQAND